MHRIYALIAGLLIIVTTAAGQPTRVSFSAKDRLTSMPVQLDSVRIENLSTMRDTVITNPFIIDLEISTGMQDRLPGLVQSLDIGGNFSNPFTDATNFTVTNGARGVVRFELFSLTGRREAGMDARLEAGTHRFSLKAASLPAGVYLLTARAGESSRTVRIVKNGTTGGGSPVFSRSGNIIRLDVSNFGKARTAWYRFTGYADSYYPESYEAAPAGDTAIVFDMVPIETVTIGTQVWMLKNLDVDKYRNGDSIPQVTDPAQWLNLRTGAWCYYTNDPAMGAIYGKLYNWYAVNDPRGLAPAGWHVPTDDEWKTLEVHLGMTQTQADSILWRGTNEGGKLKEAGTAHWQSPNAGADNSSGFTVLPGGYRSVGGTFINSNSHGYWWSSTATNAPYIWTRLLYYNRAGVCYNGFDRSSGYSVRCLKD